MSNRWQQLASGSVTALLLLAACAPDTPADPLQSQPSFSVNGAPAQLGNELAALRQLTARFANFETANAAGYDTPITPCWAHRTHGAMGYHYAKPALIDGSVNLLEPETLMYEPQPGGHLKLVGMEYIVPLAAWTGSAPPALLGVNFTQHSTLPIYKLHIWLWRINPSGIFADWNPKVSCSSAADTEIFE